MSTARPSSRNIIFRLLPMLVVVFIVFLVIGMAMPVLPLHVHDRLGLGTIAVGIIAGGQFAASLVSRLGSGRVADRRGAKTAVSWGLAAGITAGACYLASLVWISTPVLSAGVLLAGRALLGAAESFVITGALAWGFTVGGEWGRGCFLRTAEP